MPIYEYQCDDCGERSEVIQRLSEDPLTKCGSCDGALRRLISAPAVQFKGTGWYVTDYGSRKGGGDSKEGPASGDSNSSADSTEKKAGSESSKKTAGSSPSD